MHSNDSRRGLKFQCRTWIRQEIHVSILHTSYTNTINYGTYHVVVAHLFERPTGAVDAQLVSMHWLRRCAGSGERHPTVLQRCCRCCRGVAGVVGGWRRCPLAKSGSGQGQCVKSCLTLQRPCNKLGAARTLLYNVFYSKLHMYSSFDMSLTPTAAFNCLNVKRLRFRGGLLPATQAGVEHAPLK